MVLVWWPGPLHIYLANGFTWFPVKTAMVWLNLEVVHFKKSSYFRHHLVGNLVVEVTIFYRALLLFVRTTDARITIYAPYQLIATKQYETYYKPLVESLLIHASFP